jgi:hypothetical protein
MEDAVLGNRRKSAMTLTHVREKVDECRFFLALANKENAEGGAVNYGYCISAFLCSFACFFDRLEHLRSEREVCKLLDSHQDWKYLGRTLRDNEVHGVGGACYVRPSVSQASRPRRRSRFASRLRGRFSLSWDVSQYDRPAAVQFVRFCSSCVSKVEECLVAAAGRHG